MINKEIESIIEANKDHIIYLKDTSGMAEEDIYNELDSIFNDYLTKKDSKYIVNLQNKEIISYYNELISNLIDVAQKTKKYINKANKSLVEDYINLMYLMQNVGLESANGAILIHTKKYDRKVYDDFVLAVNKQKDYINSIVEKLKSYNEYIYIKQFGYIDDRPFSNRYFEKIDTMSDTNQSRRYINESYEDGMSPQDDFRLIKDYYQATDDRMQVVVYVMDNYKSIATYTFYVSMNKDLHDNNSISLNFIMLICFILMIYMIFPLIFNLIIASPNKTIKQTVKYLNNELSVNKDLSSDINVLLQNEIGKVISTFNELSFIIKSVIVTK